jgi:DNA-binding response OmpR family regulator
MTAGTTTSDARTALVADDDADLGALVCEVLRGLGIATRSVARGDDALLAVRAHAPRLLVLDVTMPGLSGLEVCRVVKQSGLADDVAVLLVSGESAPADIAAGRAAGADDYLAKPFSCAQLAERVSALLPAGER